MANTLTNLIPIAYEALDVVSREVTGFIGAVNVDAAAETIAKDQTIYSPVAPVNTTGNITPAMTATAASDQTIGTKSLVIDSYKTSGFNWTAEEEFGLNSGGRFENIMRDQMAQCFRVHVNEIEAALGVAAKNGASRAIGTTAGTAPVLADFAGAQKILTDNGAPMTGRSVVIDTTAGVALRGTSSLYKVNEAGDSGLLRNGVLGSLYGFDIRESAGISSATAGTGASYTTTAAGFAVGTTAIPLITGTGTVLAGDIVTFAGDSNKYVVAAGVSAPGTITLAAPGLKVAMSAATKAMTIFSTSARNIALSKNAITLATRLPKFQAGDQAADRYVITDPQTGIAFEIAMYPGYRMVKYEVSIAYGMSVIKPEHLAVIIG
tara:strand:- start:180 stop:1313 length:1134 start_codon:yes stop_codon:yes gene_type:complete